MWKRIIAWFAAPPKKEVPEMIDSYSPEHEAKLEERINFLGYVIGITMKRMQNPNYGIMREYGTQQMGASIELMKTERLALILQVEAIREFNKG